VALRSWRRWSSALLLTTAAVLLAACGTSAPGGSCGSAPPPPHTDLPVPVAARAARQLADGRARGRGLRGVHAGQPAVPALLEPRGRGRPVVTDGSLHTVGGTSGSSPLTAAATALVAGTEKAAGRPPLGLVNGWFYAAAAPA
jgi:hypothetical protein